MKEILFTELRSRMEEVREKERNANAEVNEKNQGLLLDSVRKIISLSNTARREGLLALEDAVSNFTEAGGEKYIKSMILLIVDGTDPELVEEIGWVRYFSSGIKDYDAVSYLLCLTGALAIQAGENPRLTEVKLLAMIPEELTDVYRKKEEEKVHSCPKKESDMSRVEALYKGELAVEPDDDSYFLMKLADYAFRKIDDRGMQRLLQNVDKHDLALAMKGLSGEARQCFLKNVSQQFAVMIAEDMEFMGAVRVRDVAVATRNIFNTLLKLISYGEIVSDESMMFKNFYELFWDDEADERQREKNGEIAGLQKLLEEYSSQKNKQKFVK